MRKAFYFLLIACFVALETFIILRLTEYRMQKPAVAPLTVVVCPSQVVPAPVPVPLPAKPAVKPVTRTPQVAHKPIKHHKETTAKPKITPVVPPSLPVHQEKAYIFLPWQVVPPASKPACTNPFGCFLPYKPYDHF